MALLSFVIDVSIEVLQENHYLIYERDEFGNSTSNSCSFIKPLNQALSSVT